MCKVFRWLGSGCFLKVDRKYYKPDGDRLRRKPALVTKPKIHKIWGRRQTMLNDKVLSIYNGLFKCFSQDPAWYVVPQVTVLDGLGRKHIIHFAIVSKTVSKHKVAVLIKPSYVRSADFLQAIDLEVTVNLLYEQGWTPVVYQSDELLSHFEEVEAELKQIVYGGVTPQGTSPSCAKLPSSVMSLRRRAAFSN